MIRTFAFLPCFLFLILISHQANANEPWQLFDTQTQASLRGLAAVDSKFAWACGSKGTIVRTTDGGSTWNAKPIPGLESVEIRSIHVWDADNAIVATAGQPAKILKTVDGGSNWSTVYEHGSPQAFFDGLRFWDTKYGVAFSDPVDGGLLIVTTSDRGETWQEITATSIPPMLENEAGFAASNSTLFAGPAKLAWIGLGGDTGNASRVFRTDDFGQTWTAHPVKPIATGASAGIFSVCFSDEKLGVAVGGDYQKEATAEQNIAISDDGGISWREPRGDRPRGFRSCVVSLTDPNTEKRVWYACGPSGCDWSSDRETWQSLSDTGFHTMFKAADNSIWAAGSKGRVARLAK